MPEYSNLFVVLMGLGTVFAGLLCIILLVTLMSWVSVSYTHLTLPTNSRV